MTSVTVAQPLQLTASVDTVLYPSAPFNFAATFYKPSHFPSPDVGFSAGVYRQSLRWDGQWYGLRCTDSGTVDQPAIALRIYYDPEQMLQPPVEAIVTELRFRFDLDTDLTGFVELCGNDPMLHEPVAHLRGMRVSTPYSLYEFLVIGTVLQNTVIRRSIAMLHSLFERYGTWLAFDDVQLCGFWDPATIAAASEPELRELKVGYRSRILRRQAQECLYVDPVAWRALETPDLRRSLLAIYGIGPATVQYVLFEVFHRYECCEYLPPWERAIFSHLLFGNATVDGVTLVMEVEQRYDKWRMLALHYLFEDLFRRHAQEPVEWLTPMIRR